MNILCGIILRRFFPIWFKEKKYIAPSSGTLNSPWNKFTLIQSSLFWNNLPREIKETRSTEEFKKRLKKHGRNM